MTRFDVSSPAYRTREAAVLQDEASLGCEVDQTRIADLALTVAREALVDAKVSEGDHDPARAARFGVVLGTSHGGNIAFHRFVRARGQGPLGTLDPALLLSTTATIAGQIAARVGARGETVMISTACASGCNAVGRAAEMIRRGRADVVVAGGADLFTELSFSGFNILGATAPGPCRPLDRDRDGMMLGDAAAMVVLESEEHARRRGARPWIEIGGHAIANDAHHATAPEPDGAHAARVMKEALAAAGMTESEIDFVSLHGTGTVANDESELMAVARVFGARAKDIAMSSGKSMFGHTLGAAGALEIVATALGLAHGFAPPTLHLQNAIVGFEDWSFVRDRARVMPLRAAIKNSFGFSGNLSSIVLKRFDGDR